jgi:hypothetical protein
MPYYSFDTFITIEADNYDDAIDVFDYKLKTGINRSDVFVAEIEEILK